MKRIFIKALIPFILVCLNLKGDNYKIKTIQLKKNATIDLTIKKISSKPLIGIIDRLTKTILIEIEDTNDIYLTENLKDFNDITISGLNNNLSSEKDIIIRNLSYNLINFNNKKIVKLDYEIEPENLYIGIIDKKRDLKKVYKINYIEDLEKKFEYLGLTIENSSKIYFNESSQASTEIIVNNPNGSKLAMNAKNLPVKLRNQNFEIEINKFNIEETIKKNQNIFKITGIIEAIPNNIPSGEYKGTLYLELYAK